MSELLQTRLESGDPQSGRAHVDAATAGAEVHRHSNDSDFLRHLFCFSRPGTNAGTSRIDAIEHPWEGDDFANVLGSANPGHGALEPKPEARVRYASIAPQVEVPLERFFRQ